ncbi:putative ATP/GTP-binding protein [Aeropyrum pernix]|uniref:Putative ATP/GTP-binding protein n=1 Tax=Aeropyrum pernix TaxID=56636 RepID=A0A401HA35_AERPX|nr:putative ATP/GTP-binding protein [Aeropyrum pernix]
MFLGGEEGLIGYIIVTGTAGAGKSSLVGALADRMASLGANVATLNLDPAAEKLPYDPSVDARDYVSVAELMDKGLGPNGALVAAVDSLINHVLDIREEIDYYSPDYVVVDTPGQLELFAYRVGGPLVLRGIMGDYNGVNIFLIDSIFIDNAISLVSALLLASSVAVRLGLPQVNAVSKADMLLPEVREEVIPRLGEPGFLEFLLEKDKTYEGAGKALAEELARAIETTGFIGEVLQASVLEPETITLLAAKAQQILAGGDDYKIYDITGQ